MWQKQEDLWWVITAATCPPAPPPYGWSLLTKSLHVTLEQALLQWFYVLFIPPCKGILCTQGGKVCLEVCVCVCLGC